MFVCALQNLQAIELRITEIYKGRMGVSRMKIFRGKRALVGIWAADLGNAVHT